MKKAIFLITITLLLVAGWSIGWFFVTDQIETTITKTKTRLTDKGREVNCTNQEINGYPFRISLNCDQIRYSDKVTGLVFEAGALKSAAQAYQPNKAVVELKSPANLTLPNTSQFNATWSSMRSSIKAGLSGPQNVSIQGKQVALLPKSEATPPMSIEDLQFHARKVADNDLNLAVVLDGASSQANRWPSFDLNSTLLLKDTYSDVISRASLLRVAKTRGLQGEIQAFRYAPNKGGTLTISGPASIDSAGLLSGDFEVTVQELGQLISALGESFPSQKEKFDNAATTVSLLSKQSGKSEVTLPIKIRSGTINVGFIPVGKLPPLF